MKLLTLTCGLFILFLQNLKSQDSLKPVFAQDTALKTAVYRAYVYHPHRLRTKGYLVTITDSSLYISQNKMPLNFGRVNLSNLEKFDYKSLTQVKVATPHGKGNALIIGAAAGIVIGAIIGYSGGNDSGWFGLTAGGKAFIGGIIGGGVGCLVGGIVSTGTETRYFINGEWQSLQDMKNSLQMK
jgi:hypothetical protein